MCNLDHFRSRTTPFVPTSAVEHSARPRDLATQQSWNADTKRFKCYLCNPVRLGFHTLTSLNEHVASPEHKARRCKCPLATCNLPFYTIGGLVQHIETRSCRCIIDSRWWNTYLTLPRRNERPWEDTSLAAGSDIEEELELEEDSSSVDTEDELALEDYWVGHYTTMTGPNGSWDSDGDTFITRAGLELLAFGRWVRTITSWVGSALLPKPKFLTIPFPVLFLVSLCIIFFLPG